MDHEIYEPEEDSFLLEKYVKQYAKGLVLDLGTGSGIQAKAASKKADFVIAVDINQKALEYCNRHLKSDKILCLNSDLFSFFEKKVILIKNRLFKGIKDIENNVNNKFDTIIFNPPYLPEDKNNKDMALDGGKRGFELIEKFLNQAGKFLAENGLILLIFSSKTGKKAVDKLIPKNGFKFFELEKIHVFFEDIYCYRIERK